MRIIRFIDGYGREHLGTDLAGETAEVLAGDVFGELQRTGQRVEVREEFRPILPARAGAGYRGRDSEPAVPCLEDNAEWRCGPARQYRGYDLLGGRTRELSQPKYHFAAGHAHSDGHTAWIGSDWKSPHLLEVGRPRLRASGTYRLSGKYRRFELT